MGSLPMGIVGSHVGQQQKDGPANRNITWLVQRDSIVRLPDTTITGSFGVTLWEKYAC